MTADRELLGALAGQRYRLDEPTREGRQGWTWTGRTADGSTPVLVEILRPELFPGDHALVRFEHLARTLTRIRHPNLLRVLDHGRAPDGEPFLVHERHAGRLLADEIGRSTLSVSRACHLALQIAAALAAVHRHGIAHGGLAPDLVLLDREPVDHVRLYGFGPAPALVADLAQGVRRLGRLEYATPEAIRHGRVDARSDVYALGIVLFEMITGQPPFVGPARSVQQKHLDTDPWPVSELCEQRVPPWLDRLVIAMLSKDPGQRPPHGLAVARALTYEAWPT